VVRHASTILNRASHHEDEGTNRIP
jgi:hypothetical protein